MTSFETTKKAFAAVKDKHWFIKTALKIYKHGNLDIFKPTIEWLKKQREIL